MMNKIEPTTLDVISNKLNKIKDIIPEAFCDGILDIDKLKQELGIEINNTNERYEFSWNGKSESIKLSQTQSMGTLRYSKEESKMPDTTENIYIEGDNLEVLKLLQKSYFGKIKMIYIDPPYNTGKDFVYKDNFKDNISNYKEITNQSTKANPETNGRYHTDWLNMMYPRLKLARNLLKEDGVIFISIDDNEVYNLKKICDEIYGEDNYIGTFSWVKTETPSNLSNKIKESVEYILCYEKSKNNNKFRGLSKVSKSSNGLMNQTNSEKVLVFPKNVVDTGIQDGVIKAGIYGTKSYTIELLEDCEVKDGYFITPIKLRGKFKWGQDKLNREIEECNTKISIRTIALSPSYEKEEYEAESPWNIINKKFGVGTNEDASSEIETLMGKKIFSYPKPVSLLKYITNFIVDKDDLVLDFFSGSSTTAHAIMELNAEDNGNRKFIMVQLPELLDIDSEAYKEGYRNLCEIGRERIKRAGDKIVSDSGKTGLDIGFKVFKLDDSNIKTWSPNYDALEETLDEMTDNLKIGRTKEDLLYEILIKMGIELTAPIEEINVGDKKIYNIGMGSLVLCLEDEITEDIISEIPKYKSDFVDMKVVFKETGFKNDSQKMNAMQNLKQFGITDVRSV